MALPRNKTKIVATIGPASDSSEMLGRLTRAGLNVARLNFSHGDRIGRRVAIMADLPGPKIRIGRIEPETIQLHAGENFVLTLEEIVGSPERVSVSFKDLQGVVKRGDRLFLNEGLVQLTVERVAGREVHCKVSVWWRIVAGTRSDSFTQRFRGDGKRVTPRTGMFMEDSSPRTLPEFKLSY